VAVARAADLVLFDLKHMDPEAHRLATGRDNHQILANLQRLSADVVDLWVRIPLIPGVNVDSDNLVRTGRFLAALPRRHPVHLLPYHRIGNGKIAALGQGGRAVFTPLEPVQVESAREHLEAFGLEVSIGGST
jgi:pyruvate formate lyase activating enzyme